MRAILILVLIVSAIAVRAQEVPASRSVLAYGAKADGVSDCTDAFQHALADAGNEGGGIVMIPAGTYLIGGNLTLPPGVTLTGVLTAPPSAPRGSILLSSAGKGDESAQAFITMHDSSTVKGLVVIYPEQSKSAPVAYPWCIKGAGDNCSVIDVLLLNPWQAIDFGSQSCGRHYIHGVNAQPIRRGIYIDRCYDIGRIENVHLWPFWTVGDKEGPFIPLSRRSCEGFIFGRSDWEYVSNSFTIACGIGMRFIRSKDPAIGAGNYLLTQSGADMSETAVLVEETQDHSGISFVNSQLFGDVIVKPTNNGMVRFTGCGFFGSLKGDQGTAQAILDGRGRISFDNCTFHCIDPANKGKTLIVANSGRIGIVNCQFVTSEFTNSDPAQIYLGPKVVSAIIVANEFNGKMRIDNHAGGQVKIAENTTDTEASYNAIVDKRGQIPISELAPCTEKANFVPNGDFERLDAGQHPIGWTLHGDIRVGAAAARLAPGWPGKTVALCNPGNLKLPAATMTCELTLKPNTDYILSGYVWNFPHGKQIVMANIDVGVETKGYIGLVVSPNLHGAERGYFVYGRFNTAKTGARTLVRVFFDGTSGCTDPKLIGAQWDRIAVTEASQFSPPKKR